jgi:hypothetical protein
MSSENQTRILHRNKTEQKADLSGHYREIGIKAVAAAARKESAKAPQSGEPIAINRNRNNNEEGSNE